MENESGVELRATLSFHLLCSLFGTKSLLLARIIHGVCLSRLIRWGLLNFALLYHVIMVRPTVASIKDFLVFNTALVSRISNTGRGAS